MNTYNENLYSTVVATLQNQELDQKKKSAQLNAAAFTLYYAEGAKITAGERLGQANRAYDFWQDVKTQAVTNNNIVTNLLDSANQLKQYGSQAVTNAAVCAANVQVAANAVLRLASDMGSIYSMIRAANDNTNMDTLAAGANNYMNDVAYLAELTSKMAMEASMLTAEISSATVADKARATSDAVGNLLKVTSSQFDSAASLVAAGNTSLESASAAEKKAEGVLEDVNLEFYASQAAYDMNVRELNLNLRVPPGSLTNTQYVVHFSPYRSPYTVPGVSNPVKKYCIMLVKESQKSTFSSINAEFLAQSPHQCIMVDPTLEQGRREFRQEIFISDIHDSDGDDMKLGDSYVVFLLVMLDEKYKKALGSSDDYLSAPSAAFALTNQLKAPDAQQIEADKAGHTITFMVPAENKDYSVKYRCILLPHTKDLVEGMLTEDGLRTIKKEVENLEKIADKYDPLITGLEAELNSINSRLASLSEERRIKMEKGEDKKELANEEKEIKELKKQREELSRKLDRNKESREKAMRISTAPTQPGKPGFFFNLTLSMQVPESNYSTATIHKGKDEKHAKGEVTIHPDTLDNFGNPLVAGKEYIPAILVVSEALEENQGQFTNALSDFTDTPAFKYERKEINKH